jgi:hypothetical protein
MGIPRNAMQQFLYVISEPESQHNIERSSLTWHISDQKPGFLDGIITAVQVKLATIRASIYGGGGSPGPRIDE